MSTAIYYVQINVTCILILGLLLLSIPKYNIKTLRSVLFNIMLVTTIIYCFSDLFAGLFRGETFSGARAILWISNILYSTSMLTLAFTWILFSSAVLRGKIDRWLIWVAGGAFAIIVIMNLLTPLTGMIFYIDGDNLYHRGNFLVLNWAYSYVGQLLPYFMMASSKIDKRERRAIALYPVFPIIAGIIQILFYGVSAGQVGATASIALIYIVFQGREINEHRRNQERLEIETAMAKNASDAKGRFLANMSHEIRTPINAVLGMNTMILRESSEEQIRGYAMNIDTAGNTLLALINDILDFSKIESGKMEIEPVHYDLATLISDVHNMIKFKADAKGLETVINIDESLPSGLIGDDIRVRQVLLNIMNNAVKYTNAGSVTLTLTGYINGDRAVMHFSVKDTGIGIKEEDIPSLFGEYERISETQNRNIEGTGLGMGITTRLLELMNSKLRVKSVYGEGSEFYFDLTQEISDYAPVGDISARLHNKVEGYSYETLFTAPDARVLVVDDNGMNREVFCGLIKETEIKTDQASSGAEALDMYEPGKYDIVFLDHMMPDMDGLEVLSHIREIVPKSEDSTVFVALTANAISGSREHYLEAGFDDYMSKPIIPEMLESLLSKYISNDKINYTDISGKTRKTVIETHNVQANADASSYVAELPTVEGIDWNYAMLHYRGKEALETAVRSFYNLIMIEADELGALYESISNNPEDEKALNNYRIKVHAMKNEANLIGGFYLGGCAAGLEYASRDGQVKQVIETTPYFLNAWNLYREKLKVLPFLTDNSDKKSVKGEEDKVGGLCSELVEALSNFDIHRVDEIMKELEEYEYPEGADSEFEKLRGYASNLDPDSAEECVERLLGEL